MANIHAPTMMQLIHHHMALLTRKSLINPALQTPTPPVQSFYAPSTRARLGGQHRHPYRCDEMIDGSSDKPQRARASHR
jgi:hypothetical protein